MTDNRVFFTVEIPGQPVGWKAPFVGKHGAFSPAKYKAWLEAATLAARVAFGADPWEGPIALALVSRILKLIPDTDPEYAHRHDLHIAGYLWALSHHEWAWQSVCEFMGVVRCFWARQMARWIIDHNGALLYNDFDGFDASEAQRGLDKLLEGDV